MILPIITAVSREVFLQTPKLHEEAALALGATRWEMIRMAVLPFGRSGIISGAMLGLGRALGETMAVAIILSASGAVTFNLISSDNPSTIAANIALQFPDSTGLAVNTLIASGLVLFVITLAGQLARPLHHQPTPRVLGGELMSIDTDTSTRTTRLGSHRAHAPLAAGRAAALGAAGAVLAGSLVVVGAVLAVTGSFSIGLFVFLAVRARSRSATYADLPVRRGQAQGHRPAGDRSWSQSRSCWRWLRWSPW